MSTIVTYNGITISGALTKRFEQSPQYDSSGTDVIFSKFSFAFKGLVHAQGNPLTAPMWSGRSSTSQTLDPVQAAASYISTQLWQPRGDLRITIGGVLMFTCNGAGNHSDTDPLIDVNNGPKPHDISITHITANASLGPTFHVTFSVDCEMPACPNGTIQPVLSNRWSVGESLDDEYFTVRTISGEMIVSAADLPADLYRTLVCPALEPGFKRERIDYSRAADGLKITYSVIDKQVHTAAPWPAAKLTVRHSEATSTACNFESECHVSLMGHPGANKILLFALAMRIIEDRLGKISDIKNDNTKVPAVMSMVDVVGEHNGIEIYFKLQHQLVGTDNTTKPDAANFLGTPLGALGRPLGSINAIYPLTGAQGYPTKYDPKETHAQNLWGYDSQIDSPVDQTGAPARVSGIEKLFLKCYLQWPCSPYHGIAQFQDQSPPNDTTPPPAQRFTVVQQGPLPPYPAAEAAKSFLITANGQTSLHQPYPYNPNASPTPPPAIYTFATGETTLVIDPLRVQLPIASSPSKYQPGDDTSVFVTLGLPQASMKFHFECEAVGSWPNVPQPVPMFNTDSMNFPYGKPSKPIKGYLKSCVLTPMPPTLDVTKTKRIFHVTCELVYGLNRPPQPSEAIPIGTLPFTTMSPGDNALVLQALYNGANANLFGTESTSQQGGSQQGTGY